MCARVPFLVRAMVGFMVVSYSSSLVLSTRRSKLSIVRTSRVSTTQPPYIRTLHTRHARVEQIEVQSSGNKESISMANSLAPKWAREMNLPVQFLVGMSLYLFHTLVLSRHCVPFPVQLIPNDSGLFQSIGFDSLAGIVVVAMGLIWRPWKENPSSPPWRINKSERLKSLGVLLALGVVHFASGYIGLMCEYMLYGFAAAGVPMTVAMHRSLQVLLSHLAWVLVGTKLLGRSFHGFFSNRVESQADGDAGSTELAHPSDAAQIEPVADVASSSIHASPSTRSTDFSSPVAATNTTSVESIAEGSSAPTSPADGSGDRWLSMKFRTTWLWWAIGGYYASCWVFACADVVNQLMLPDAVFEAEALAESVVTQMVNPENNDRWAMAVASLAPCVSAPWWEEVLYRGFLLPALSLWLPLFASVPLSGVLFGLHHMMPASAVPLSALGLSWALLYVLSRNLWVTVVVHAMWNSRVFLGSLLGV